MTTLKEQYQTTIRPALQKALGLKNPMEVPRLEKIVLNTGIKSVDKDVLKEVVESFRKMTGQAPVVVKAKKSISNFKLREGMDIGAKVTLRGDRMYDFFSRMVGAALPRIRDFRGLPGTGFDGRGNYNFGIQDQTIFPEIEADDVKKVHGMDIAIVTSSRTDKEAFSLLKHLGMPFAEEKREE
ncbi:MAG: 50S ribosomal protein L5 [bacterium]